MSKEKLIGKLCYVYDNAEPKEGEFRFILDIKDDLYWTACYAMTLVNWENARLVTKEELLKLIELDGTIDIYRDRDIYYKDIIK